MALLVGGVWCEAKQNDVRLNFSLALLPSPGRDNDDNSDDDDDDNDDENNDNGEDDDDDNDCEPC